MICPHCSKGIHFIREEQFALEYDSEESLGRAFEGGFCPSCQNIIVISYTGEYSINNKGIGYVERDETNPYVALVYPYQSNHKISSSEEVPRIYLNDYREALEVQAISPKASAALSRRCLQNFLHNELNIKKKNLAQEIEHFVQNEQAPSYIIDSVDAIRNIGNFAAHPIKNTNTGEIVDVEPGEAEWLLEVLEMLFDFYFVYPKKIERRKEELNNKLRSLGKPVMN